MLKRLREALQGKKTYLAVGGLFLAAAFHFYTGQYDLASAEFLNGLVALGLRDALNRVPPPESPPAPKA